jgi:GDP-L-fucose synthase
MKKALISGVTGQDGTPRKLMDNVRINKLGWQSTTNLQEGISKTYNWYKNYICSK